MHYKELLDTIHKAGYSKVIASYSGGNDSGGVDHLRLVKHGQTDDPATAHDTGFQSWEPDGTGGYEFAGKHFENQHVVWRINNAQGEPAPWLEQVEDIAIEPYGSFAGDYSVDGMVVFDTVAKTIERQGSMQTWVDDYESGQIWSADQDIG